LDVESDARVIHNAARAEMRLSPCSTFKIPNTLIALETGVVDGPGTTIEWDRQKYPKQPSWDFLKANAGVDWARDHTLSSAFEHSCVWFYQEVAKQIGVDRMTAFLKRFDYGNQDVSGGIDRFWLESSLKVSAMDQAAFLKRFVLGELGLTEKTRRDALEVFERERSGDAVLYAKTGGCYDLGWFVGFVDNGGDKSVFTFNMAGTYEETSKKRISLSLEMLRALGAWP
jgi:beta-lactamase class D